MENFIFVQRWLLRRKPIQQNYQYFFKDFEPKWALEGLMKLKLVLKMVLLEISLKPIVAVSQAMTQKLCFRYFCESSPVL